MLVPMATAQPLTRNDIIVAIHNKNGIKKKQPYPVNRIRLFSCRKQKDYPKAMSQQEVNYYF